MGPRHPVLSKFDSKDVLVELDNFLNYCDKKGISDKVTTEININTFNYIKQCKKQKTPKHVLLTKPFLKKYELIAVPFDKGIDFCLMKQSAYEDKLSPILQYPCFKSLKIKGKIPRIQ